MPDPDPDFPNRPAHQDFDVLSETVCVNDLWADRGMPLPMIIAEYADIDSTLYMAQQRALRVCINSGMGPAQWTVYSSLWIDGFLAGVALGRTQGDNDG